MGFLYVGLGGALGAMLRYSISIIPVKSTFPVLTLIVNVIGAFIIGFVTGFAVKRKVPENMQLFLKTGLCGGFTTFSTFSLEAYNLFSNGNHMTAVLYAIISTVLCVFGVWLGIMLSSAVVKD